jgi:AcrR family transcriptional regulator
MVATLGPGPMSSGLTTEARILEVASRLFYERGYEATTTRDLAKEVGIKESSLYNHFADKQEILVRLCLTSQRDFLDGAVLSLEGVEDVRERLRTLVLWQVTAEAQHPYKARVVDAQLHALNPVSRRKVIKLRDAYDDLLTSILIEGNEEGYWRTHDPRVICMGIIGMCNISAWYRDNGSLTPEEIGERYATFLLDALSLDASSRISQRHARR